MIKTETALLSAPEEVQQVLPRPEYPRPQFVREDWMNLNGPWEFQFDADDRGIEQKWYLGKEEFSKRIIVPFSCEAPLSEIGDLEFHPCVWYKRTFSIPESWIDKRLLLHFGAVDYRASVWVNEVLVATHEGGHTPFSTDITTALLEGENMVIVRAEDPPSDRYIPRGKQYWEQKPASIFYARTTGIWQTVWLEPVPKSHLHTAWMTPVLEGTVSFDVRLINAMESQMVTVAISANGRLVASGMSLADGPRASVGARIENPMLWSPDSPFLYDAKIELSGPEGVIDTVTTYFGFRSIAAQDGKVLLNGHPIFLKTVLDQGYWPESNLTPPSDEAIREDILIAKRMGFNGVRKHQKVEDPRYLYWADKLGLLVSAEMANAYLFNEEAVARITREWIEVVKRDYNHPCIIIWVPVNESWGVPNLAQPKQRSHLRALYHLTKSLDDTRLVIDNDGWEHTEATDLFAIHDYTRTGADLFSRFQEYQRRTRIPTPLYGKLYLAPGSQDNQSPIFLSEFGGIGFILPDEHSWVPENSWGYSGVEPTEAAAMQRLRGLFVAVARIPEIAGVCYTQLYDVEQEVNGLLTYGRRPKFPIDAIREVVNLLDG